MLDANTYYLNEELSRQEAADAREAMIDEMAKSMAEEEYNMMAVTNKYGSEYVTRKGYNCMQAVAELPAEDFEMLGKALVEGKFEVAGLLLSEAIKRRMLDEAKYKAEQKLGI